MTTDRLLPLIALVLALGAVYLFILAPAGNESPVEIGDAANDAPAIGSQPQAVGPSSRTTDPPNWRPVSIGEREQATAAATTTGAGEILLQFADADALAAFRRSELPFGTVVIDESAQLLAVRVSWRGQDARDALLARFPEATAETNQTVYAPEVPRASTEPGVARPAAFGLLGLSFVGVNEDNATWGNGVVVAILDTGIEPHQLLADTAIKRLDLLPESATRQGPYSGHGTAVAAIVAATDPIARGVAPASQLLDVRVLDGNGVGDAFTVAQGIVAAVDAGADVINLSLGSYADARILRRAVDYAIANDVTLVAAVGNDGNDSVLFPAAYDDVIAVTAIDANSQRPSFANTGGSIDLAAPGTEVLSAWSDERFVRFSGTSAAAPFVAGAVAAGKSQLPNVAGDAWQELLLWTSNDVGAAGDDPAHGEGILNVGRLLNSQTPGIHDAAVASHLIDAAAAADIGADEIPVTIVVENRGTTTDTLKLTVDMAGATFQYEFPDLAPGQSAAAGLAVDAAELRRTGGFDLETTVTTGSEDANPDDNGKVSRLVPAPAAGDD